ncbi:HlyD family efflux transporter periplasmic adaptor subunit [Flavobacteriaceae bacterium F08102]|nr:HlyD family efflux transporter periplasmic adaptor subunit [Flavobacteriaceae bacterium F08102]
MRKNILIALGLLLLTMASFTFYYLVKNKNQPKPTFEKVVKSVFIDTVFNSEIPIVITTSGNLRAKNKIELYAEVQGLLKQSTIDFKAGSAYRKGQVLLSINSDEFYASLQAQKSDLYNLLTSIMPDIRLDFPNQFQKWESYLHRFDLAKPTPKLPTFSSDKEKYFISGRGINSSYYSVKNLEVKLNKYTIRAPFSGILTEALVTPGSLVRVGQKLGEFIDPRVYELEVAINASYADLLKVGNQVSLHNLERTKSYKGQVIRINGKVDQASQTIKVFISVADEDLKEGMYLEADLIAKSEPNAIEIPRKLLVDNKGLYIVKDSILELIDVTPVYYGTETAVITGIPDHTLILSQPVLGAFSGMQVNITHKK